MNRSAALPGGATAAASVWTVAGSSTYSPEQRIINYRDGHIQVVACAGSGKTDTVAMRVAALLAEGVPPSTIVAFTFTNAAAAALKARILKKVRAAQADFPLDHLSPMFLGTIHSFCLRFLQERVPRYATFDLFEDHRLVGLLSREYFNLGLDQFKIQNRTDTIRRFLESAAVVENEMLDPKKDLPRGTFRNVYLAYLDLLDRYHVLTHNQCIAQAVLQMRKLDVHAYDPKLSHLIVDEFQDINPAQERLIELMGRPPVHVCVVGDDDQAIYQWRGSSIEYIRRFRKTFRAATQTLAINRRSRENIVNLAAKFATSIPQRLDKKIVAEREADPREVHSFVAPTADAEAEMIADAIKRMHDSGIAYRDIAILLRSVRTSGDRFLDAFDKRGIRYKCVGRTGLFFQPEADLLGRVFAFLAGRDQFYNARVHETQSIELEALMPYLRKVFSLKPRKVARVRDHLRRLRRTLPTAREVDLVGAYYRLLRLLCIHRWKIDDADQSHRLGVLARFSELLADFESVTRRARRVREGGDGERVSGGLSGGETYLDRLANYISFYAQTEYDDFEGEPDFDFDGVTVTTVHQAKGLEWSVVFVPCLSANRFPSSRTGSRKEWLLPRNSFPAARYEGGDGDERRLFYVAVTRARDFLYLSTHQRVSKKRVDPSPYFLEATGEDAVASDAALWTPGSLPRQPQPDEDKPTFAFSDLVSYFTCPLSYRFRIRLGFQPPAAKELGYGKAVHHILRRMAEFVKKRNCIPRPNNVANLLDREFYLPYADRPAYDLMRAKASKLVSQYLTDFSEDLRRVWEVERSFELHLPDANLTGRADVILDREGGVPNALALVDYKTKPDPTQEPIHALQLAVYAAAARGEGFNVRAAYLHDLSARRALARKSVAVGDPELTEAKLRASAVARGIRGRRFAANVGPHCRTCDVRFVCRHGPAKDRA
jgi:DNA helicase-2/ATP-dependent DNA helicase PcrA